MGEVYLAEHPRLPRHDAIKVLSTQMSADEQFRARFKREADAAAGMFHPNIVGVHDRGEFHGRLWIAMDFIDGTDAGQLMKTQFRRGMPVDVVSAIVTAMSAALDYAHQRKLLHRDVKPANVLLTQPHGDEQRILLADFGIARQLGSISGLTSTNFTLGTVAYCAPEQLMGKDLDGRADQYALAASAFQLLTGAPPFEHSNPAVVISHHIGAEVPRLGERRPELMHLDQVLARGLAKYPIDRFPRCRDFAAAFAECSGVAHGDSHAMAATSVRMRTVIRPAHMIDSNVYGLAEPGVAVTAEAPAPAKLAPLPLPALRIPKRAGGGSRRTTVVLLAGAIAFVAVVGAAIGIPALLKNQPSRSSSTPSEQSYAAGPVLREVPDVSSLSYEDAITKLKAAGFSNFRQAASLSTPELVGKVVATDPPANQPLAAADLITVIVGSGAETRQIPDVTGQTVDLARRSLTIHGFTKSTQTQVDSPRPVGEVIGTNPPKGQMVSVDAVIELRVSKGNQFQMPDLIGMLWTDAESRLRALGWTGVLDKGPDVDTGGSQHNRVMYQSPPAGAGSDRDGIVTLQFGQ